MEHKYMMNADDVSEALNISKSHAYKVIRKMNEELKQEGFLVINGKVPSAYLEKKIYGYTA